MSGDNSRHHSVEDRSARSKPQEHRVSTSRALADQTPAEQNPTIERPAEQPAENQAVSSTNTPKAQRQKMSYNLSNWLNAASSGDPWTSLTSIPSCQLAEDPRLARLFPTRLDYSSFLAINKALGCRRGERASGLRCQRWVDVVLCTRPGNRCDS